MTQGIQKYRRVSMRLREKFRDEPFSLRDLEDAIFLECGTDPRTVKSAILMMKRLELMVDVQPEREFGVMPVKIFKLTPKQNEYF